MVFDDLIRFGFRPDIYQTNKRSVIEYRYHCLSTYSLILQSSHHGLAYLLKTVICAGHLDILQCHKFLFLAGREVSKDVLCLIYVSYNTLVSHHIIFKTEFVSWFAEILKLLIISQFEYSVNTKNTYSILASGGLFTWEFIPCDTKLSFVCGNIPQISYRHPFSNQSTLVCPHGYKLFDKNCYLVS